MNLLDRLMWWVATLFPSAGRPEFLQDLPVGRGPTGPDWPLRHAASRGVVTELEPDGGLISEFSSLQGPNFDVSAVPDLTRLFYEHTARFRLDVRPKWLEPVRWGAWFWAVLWARRWGQLELPLTHRVRLTNELWSMPGKSAVWVRRFCDDEGQPTDRALYVSRYDVVRVAGQPDPCVRISFPVPGGTWVVLFRAQMRGSVLVLTEAGGERGGPGLYLVPEGGPARYIAALREEIAVQEGHAGARADHTFDLFGVRILTLSYALPLAEASRSEKVVSSA